MKVQGGLSRAVARAYESQSGGTDPVPVRSVSGAGAASPRTDSIAVSSTLQEVGRLRATVAAAPDSRSDEVAALRSSISSGAYTIDVSALAGTLIGA